jgi:hypothetical protein
MKPTNIMLISIPLFRKKMRETVIQNGYKDVLEEEG